MIYCFSSVGVFAVCIFRYNDGISSGFVVYGYGYIYIYLLSLFYKYGRKSDPVIRQVGASPQLDIKMIILESLDWDPRHHISHHPSPITQKSNKRRTIHRT